MAYLVRAAAMAAAAAAAAAAAGGSGSSSSTTSVLTSRFEDSASAVQLAANAARSSSVSVRWLSFRCTTGRVQCLQRFGQTAQAAATHTHTCHGLCEGGDGPPPGRPWCRGKIRKPVGAPPAAPPAGLAVDGRRPPRPAGGRRGISRSPLPRREPRRPPRRRRPAAARGGALCPPSGEVAVGGRDHACHLIAAGKFTRLQQLDCSRVLMCTGPWSGRASSIAQCSSRPPGPPPGLTPPSQSAPYASRMQLQSLRPRPHSVIRRHASTHATPRQRG